MSLSGSWKMDYFSTPAVDTEAVLFDTSAEWKTVPIARGICVVDAAALP